MYKVMEACYIWKRINIDKGEVTFEGSKHVSTGEISFPSRFSGSTLSVKVGKAYYFFLQLPIVFSLFSLPSARL